MVRRIQFKPVKNKFQSELSQDAKRIRNSSKVFVPADKTTNLYTMQVSEYKKLLNDNITAKYKKASNQVIKNINKEAKSIATNLELDNRIEQYSNKSAFITIKDHKPNFPNNIKCRLINPAKSQIGIVSKQLLDNINRTIRSKKHLNQWRNSSTVISWFQNIPDKKTANSSNLILSIFTPQSQKNSYLRPFLLQNYSQIDDDAIQIIEHSRKSLLFNEKEAWIKNSDSLFDVTMGSFDGAEICELVGLFILNKLSNIIPTKDLGLYRDDGLAVLRNKSGPEMERTRKNIIKAFKEIQVNITAETNLFQTDFLDVTFNLKSNKFFPYRKPNDHPLYINNQSNHPPSIRKQQPDMINDRISKLSHNQDSFNQASPLYTEVLKNSDYKTNMTYNKAVSAESKNDEQRKNAHTKIKEKETLFGSTLPTTKKYRPT